MRNLDRQSIDTKSAHRKMELVELRGGRIRGKVWDHFYKVSDSKRQCKCNYCKQSMYSDPKRMIDHLLGSCKGVDDSIRAQFAPIKIANGCKEQNSKESDIIICPGNQSERPSDKFNTISADGLHDARRCIFSLHQHLKQVQSSLVRDHVEATLEALSIEIENSIRIRSADGEDKILRFYVCGPLNRNFCIDQPKSATLGGFKEAIMHQSGINASHQHLSAPNVIFNVPNDTLLLTLGIVQNSVITLSYSSQINSGTSFERLFNTIRYAGNGSHTAFEALSLSLHGLVLEASFICITPEDAKYERKEKSNRAVSVENVSSHIIVPDGWKISDDTTCFRYQHPFREENVYMLRLREQDDMCIAHFGEIDGKYESAEFNIREFEDAEVCGKLSQYFSDVYNELKAELLDKVMLANEEIPDTKVQEHQWNQLKESLRLAQHAKVSSELAQGRLCAQGPVHELVGSSFNTIDEAASTFKAYAIPAGFKLYAKKMRHKLYWIVCSCAGKPPIIEHPQTRLTIRKNCKWRATIKEMEIGGNTRLVVTEMKHNFSNGHSHKLEPFADHLKVQKRRRTVTASSDQTVAVV